MPGMALVYAPPQAAENPALGKPTLTVRPD
jgi:hypothetical protein